MNGLGCAKKISKMISIFQAFYASVTNYLGMDILGGWLLGFDTTLKKNEMLLCLCVPPVCLFDIIVCVSPTKLLAGLRFH